MKPYLLGLYEKSMPGYLSIPEKLAETGAAGYGCLELSVDESDEKLSRLDWGKEEINALNLAMETCGVFIKTLCLSAQRRFPLGDPDPETRQKSLSVMEKAVILASRLGAGIVQIPGYDVYYKPSNEETEKLFAENLEKSAGIAAREGIIIAFETMETPFIDTVEKAARWVRRFKSPYLQIYPDTGNISNAALVYGTKIQDDLEKGAGHLAALHLKESKPGVYREVPYQEGHVDFAEAARTAWKLGVRLFTAEFWYSAGGPWRETLRKNNRFLSEILDTAAGGGQNGYYS
jgi:predicted hexulose-6-phosphate isomerase